MPQDDIIARGVLGIFRPASGRWSQPVSLMGATRSPSHPSVQPLAWSQPPFGTWRLTTPSCVYCKASYVPAASFACTFLLVQANVSPVASPESPPYFCTWCTNVFLAHGDPCMTSRLLCPTNLWVSSRAPTASVWRAHRHSPACSISRVHKLHLTYGFSHEAGWPLVHGIAHDPEWRPVRGISHAPWRCVAHCFTHEIL